MGRRLGDLLLLLISLGLAFGAAELFARYALATPAQRAEGARRLWENQRNDYTPSALRAGSSCTFADALLPHPNLGFVLNPESPCRGDSPVNNAGFLDRHNLPARRDPAFFSIALLGGSVASHLAVGAGGVVWLEEALNRGWQSPNGKPFRVLSGANGSWNFPNQLNFLHLYGNAVDAVVAIDGYNEASRARYHAPITQPDYLTYLTASRPTGLFWLPLSLSVLKGLRQLAHSHPRLMNSFLLYSAFDRLAGLHQRSPTIAREAERSILQFYRFPAAWTGQEGRDWNRQKFRDYLLSLKAQAEVLGLRHAHFLQPYSGLGKALTTEEKARVSSLPPELYAEVFLGAVKEAASRGVQSFSLVNAFAKEKEILYSDDVHCRYVGQGNPGYQLLSEEMAAKIAWAWRLKPKSNKQAP